MINLVLIYCLTKDLTSCVEKRPQFEDSLTVMGCMIAAQRIASEYLNENPDYELNSFRCEIDHPKQKDI
jgi:hypothetical protein